MKNVKYNFGSDYIEGCHPSILNKMQQTNLTQQTGYGEDDYSIEAKNIIRKAINNHDAAIHFVAGGTLANLIVASACLRPHEAIIAPNSGHINTHEAGAIESVGYKILPIDTDDGKIVVSDIRQVLDNHNLGPHVVKPRMVYISNSTELGTVYNRSELKMIYDFCKENNLILFVDGARLGAAISANGDKLRMEDMAEFTDVFYIGGTKNGALLGEAIVINNKALQQDFDFFIKQKGGLISKGRTIGIQFLVLFADDLFYKLANHANSMTKIMVDAFTNRGVKFFVDSKTNQIFPILPNLLIEELMRDYGFYIWKKYDDNSSIIRIVCSWATPKEAVDEFVSDVINKL
ncbi:MAG: aminotransferase class I/II-fold pyridoxal phosphate-dependent enzyme [Bacteroidales bacterium]|nr:aminotransferase class I/II-fold pyridoxal phosphate-dependent enzyme [Bacteroidales bacterium]